MADLQLTEPEDTRKRIDAIEARARLVGPIWYFSNEYNGMAVRASGGRVALPTNAALSEFLRHSYNDIQFLLEQVRGNE